MIKVKKDSFILEVGINDCNYWVSFRCWIVQKISFSDNDTKLVKLIKKAAKISAVVLCFLLAIPTLGLSLYFFYDLKQEAERQKLVLKKFKKDPVKSHKFSSRHFSKKNLSFSTPLKAASDRLVKQDLLVFPNSLNSVSLPLAAEVKENKMLFINESFKDFNSQRARFAIVPGSVLKEIGFSSTDPLIGIDLSEEKEVIVFQEGEKKSAFLVSTVVNHILSRDESDIFINQYEKIVIWSSCSEYKSLLQHLCSSFEIEEDLKSRLRDKIEGIELLKEMIEKFENETQSSFFNLLSEIQKYMVVQGRLGAWDTTEDQVFGQNLFFKFHQNLEEKIKKTIFPYYPYQTGDPICIASSGKIFNSQIKRLEDLQLIKINECKYEKVQLENLVDWFVRKQPDRSLSAKLVWEGFPVTEFLFYNEIDFLGFQQQVKSSVVNVGGFFETLAASLYFFISNFNLTEFYLAVDPQQEINPKDFSALGQRIEAYLEGQKKEMLSTLPVFLYSFRQIFSKIAHRKKLSEEEITIEKGLDLYVKKAFSSNEPNFQEKSSEEITQSSIFLKKYLFSEKFILFFLSRKFPNCTPGLMKKCYGNFQRLGTFGTFCPVIIKKEGCYFLMIERNDI